MLRRSRRWPRAPESPLHGIPGDSQLSCDLLDWHPLPVQRHDVHPLLQSDHGLPRQLAHVPEEAYVPEEGGPFQIVSRGSVSHRQRHFSTRVPVEACRLPRAGVSWLGPSWVTSGEGAHPFAREAALDLPVPEPSDRPSNIVSLADVRALEIERGSRRFSIRDLARAAGGHGRLGLRHMTLASGKLSFPLHCHTAEEEFFLVLEGAGVFLLGDEQVDLMPGTAVSRPAGTGVAHALRAADDGPLVYLASGLRDPKDVAWYPRSQKLVFRGLGNLAGRLDLTDYWDGELDG